MSTCHVPNCASPARGRGMCPRHYARWYRTGSAIGTTKPSLDELFWRQVVEDQSGCWLWTGVINRGGYGLVRQNGIQKTAHRVAYEQLIAEIPDGLQIDHLCRQAACVNPWHLEPVTAQVNLERRDLARSTA